MSDDARAHIDEAYRLLTGECYRGNGPDDMQPLEGVCTIVMDLQRVDAAIGPKGASMFAGLAETIQAAYIEISAARKALNEAQK